MSGATFSSSVEVGPLTWPETLLASRLAVAAVGPLRMEIVWVLGIELGRVLPVSFPNRKGKQCHGVRVPLCSS